jgi:chromosomal replication initiator protein
VVYSHASDFVEDYTSAMRVADVDLTDFRNKYHNCHVLLLDDVQYLENKESTTNELFNILNMFDMEGKQIVLSADRAPNELNIDVRYTSRFSHDITADIQSPNFELKRAIFNNYFQYCCEILGCDFPNIPKDVSDHIIELSSSNIRELEGAATTLTAYLTSGRQDKDSNLTIDEATRVVEKIFDQSNSKITIRMIQQEVEKFYDVSHTDLLSSQRPQSISYPRQVGMYLSRELTTSSYPEIGKQFGGKDHTTVMYAMKKVEDYYLKDPDKKKEIERLKDRIRG